MTNCWQGLNNFLFEKKESKSKSKLKLFLSPYDVPNAFRACKDSDGELFIEFRYIPIEEKINIIPHDSESNIDFEVGSVTGRVYKIIFSSLPVTSKFELEICIEEIDVAFDSLLSKVGKYSVDKYDAAREATKYCLNSVNSPTMQRCR
jgi:hypothetical protein